MKVLTDEQRILMHNINFRQLYFNAYKYYNKDKITFKQLWEYYLTLPGHIEGLTYNMLYAYYKGSMNENKIEYKYQQKEPYKGDNKVILYYLNKLAQEPIDSDSESDEDINF